MEGMTMFLDVASSHPQLYASWVGFAVFSICVHESSHARMAVRFGDETPRDYIPLNPAKQMGWLSIGMLLFIGVAWGAVPVNPRGCGGRVRNALVYLAGPLSNLGLCAGFALLAETARLWGAAGLSQILVYGSEVNGALCLLNLCPVPPLDGFGVIRSLMTEKLEIQQALNRFAGVGLLLLWLTPLGSFLFQYGAKMASLFSALWIAPFRWLS
jgi:Zn-dependent protease